MDHILDTLIYLHSKQKWLLALFLLALASLPTHLRLILVMMYLIVVVRLLINLLLMKLDP